LRTPQSTSIASLPIKIFQFDSRFGDLIPNTEDNFLLPSLRHSPQLAPGCHFCQPKRIRTKWRNLQWLTKIHVLTIMLCLDATSFSFVGHAVTPVELLRLQLWHDYLHTVTRSG
jgi:hypothetical protein